MKSISLIFGLILISLAAQAYGQSLSELDKQLKEQNEQRATEIEASQQLQQGSFTKVDCPQGTHERAISGGGIVCVDDATGKEVNPEDYWRYQIGTEGGTVGIGIVVILIIIIVAIASKKRSKIMVESKVESEGVGRRNFSQDVRERILEKQSGKCAMCGRHTSSFQFDHKDGDNSNNSLNNCQALCPNCHDRKTRGLN